MIAQFKQVLCECQQAWSKGTVIGEGLQQGEVTPSGVKEGCLSYLSYYLQVLLYSPVLLPHRRRTSLIA